VQRKLIELGVLNILEGLGADIKHADFKETPARVARMYKEVLEPPQIRWSLFPGRNYSEMVIHHAHHVWGFCPHHILPVEMEVSVGYIPRSKGYVPGLSKIPRLVEHKCRRLAIQEQVTVDIVDTLMTKLKLLGAACFITGRHLCMAMRGVRSNGYVTTSALRGVFLEKPEVKSEFLTLVHKTGMS
jgi:GTP cyclohydrolase I